jgi:ParB-like chromosome segregation protein Spo0J
MSDRPDAPATFPAYKRALIAELVPYARNARTHSDAQVAQIAASIREFGWTNPVLVDGDRGVIAGHGRLLAARKLGMAEVPTIELAHLTDAQKRAYVLADNRLALSAGWDEDLLRIELGDLRAEGFDLALTGFGPDEIGAFLLEPAAGLTDPDAMPEVPAHPVSRLGDAWVLGHHRLVCGDSTEAAAVERALAGVRPHLMVTDPPYGVD